MSIKLYTLLLLCSLTLSFRPQSCSKDNDCPADNHCHPVSHTCTHDTKISLDLPKIIGLVLMVFISTIANTTGMQGGFMTLPVYILVFHFSILESLAIIKLVNILGNVVYFIINRKEKIPGTNVPTQDFNFCLIFMPFFFLGSQYGIMMNLLLPRWILVCVCVLAVCVLGTKLYKKYANQKELEQQNYHQINTINGEDTEEQQGQVEPTENEKQIEEIINAFPSYKILFMFFCLVLFIFIMFVQGNKKLPSLLDIKRCSGWYWVAYAATAPLCALCSFLGYWWVKAEQAQLKELGYERPPEHHEWKGLECFYKVAFVFTASFTSVAMGMGGGTLINILLIEVGLHFLGAANTNNFIQIFKQIIQSLLYFAEGQLVVSWGFLFTLTSAIGATCGSLLKSYLIRKNKLSYVIMLFGFLLLVVIGVLIFISYGKIKHDLEEGKGVFYINKYCN